MKLTTVKGRITQNAAVAGLLSGQIEYEIKSGTSSLEWTGPKIDPEVWYGVLAFLKWTFDTYHSESQLRLFVNTQTQKWAAWAFPQEARTGMTARELDKHPTTADERKQFLESEGWIYIGTVHHHCSGSAFQSAVDKANEQNQDGLHITIGKLDEAHYDMHARFYLNGSEFSPDMSVFWAIGNPLQNLTPKAVWDTIARHQMTIPPPEGTAFPEKWKANIIDISPNFFVGAHAGNGSVSVPASIGGFEPLWKRKKQALSTLFAACLADSEFDTADDVRIEIGLILNSPFFEMLSRLAREFDVKEGDILEEYESQQMSAANDINPNTSMYVDY